MIFKCDWQAPFGKLLHTRYEIWFSFAGTFLINLLNENLLASGTGLEGEQMVWGVWLYLVRMNACKMSISVGNFNKNPSILFFHSFCGQCFWKTFQNRTVLSVIFVCVLFFVCSKAHVSFADSFFSEWELRNPSGKETYADFDRVAERVSFWMKLMDGEERVEARPLRLGVELFSDEMSNYWVRFIANLIYEKKVHLSHIIYFLLILMNVFLGNHFGKYLKL